MTSPTAMGDLRGTILETSARACGASLGALSFREG
jgi:hypothetical protein